MEDAHIHEIPVGPSVFEIANVGTQVVVSERRGSVLTLRYPHHCDLAQLPKEVRDFVASGEAALLPVRTGRAKPDEPWYY